MTDSPIVVALFAPFILGAAGTLAYLVQGRLGFSKRGKWWLNATGLVLACVGLLLGPLLITLTQGEANVTWLGINLAVSLLARLGLVAVSTSLLCVIIVSWSPQAADKALRMASATMFIAGLLAGALLVTDRLVSALCLLGAALIVSVVAMFPLLADIGKANGPGPDPRLLEGGWKHIALSVVATGLLVAGMLMVARHTFNIENTSMLQVGLGLLSVGLVVRAGALPFAASSIDLIEAAPQAAILMLGAVCPAVIIVGLLAFAPLRSTLSEVSWGGWYVALALGAIGALLAGIRALASSSEAVGTRASRLAVLMGSSVALQIGWALFGVFSGSRSGTLGAALIAVNLALAVPLVIASKEKIGKAVGAGALLGLPPLGGFVGMLLVAQAAVEVNGAWLLALLLGSAGVALAWLRAIDWLRHDQTDEGRRTKDEGRNDYRPSSIVYRPSGAPVNLLSWVLVAAQVAWFMLSFFIVV
jgi:NADH:ubiquinone oxidoreductase subunit 2 (subunit N)